MDHWNSDLLLTVVRFLNVTDSCRLAATSKRYYYLVLQYRRLRGPEFVASVSAIPTVQTRTRSNEELLKDAVAKIQAPPNLVLAFNTLTSTLPRDLAQAVPNDAVILGAMAPQIQSSYQGVTECKSKAACMLASLTNARVKPFCFMMENDTLAAPDFATFTQELAEQEQGNDYWKVFMVYAADSGANQVELFIDGLQKRYPNATIVGGVCSQGYVSMPIVPGAITADDLMQGTSFTLLKLNKCLGGQKPLDGIEKRELVDHVLSLIETKKYMLQLVDGDGIFGVALGGQEMPFKSMVSRGVTSMTKSAGDTDTTRPNAQFTITRSDTHRPTDPEYMFRGDDPPPYHLIRTVRDNETLKEYSPSEMVTRYGQPSFVGVRRPGEDGFELHNPHPISMNLSSFLLLTDGSDAAMLSLEHATIDLLDLDGRACMQDMDNAVRKLYEQTDGQQILGAVMVSCNGRGPSPGGLIPEAMSDATRFAKVFPNVPCLGFYAGGEIGPKALAGRDAAFQSGKVALQGFTAVFALFIVPIVDYCGMEIDDCNDNVEQFVASRLGAKGATL
jgi:small ligand-binding sensory domain FIST